MNTPRQIAEKRLVDFQAERLKDHALFKQELSRQRKAGIVSQDSPGISLTGMMKK